ncbi:MAG: hypothetical protein IJ654_04665 [Bacteroidales bacterium]|nr:hypothetical protein [Bacteroidales bacterium]
MKRAVYTGVSLLLSGVLAMAQGQKVITPYTVNPESADSVQLSNALVAKPASTATSRGKWMFGLGGGIGYSSAFGWDISICPDVAYKVNNSLFLGGQISYSYYQGESLAGVIPYARWHIVPLGKAVSVFATAYLPCMFWSDYLHLGARLKPGLAIRVSPGMYLMGSFGSVGYSYVRSGGLSGAGWVSEWSSDTIEIGVFFNL